MTNHTTGQNWTVTVTSAPSNSGEANAAPEPEAPAEDAPEPEVAPQAEVEVAPEAEDAPETAAPYADGQTIRWSGDGWWQVQDTQNYNEICSGNIDEINSCSINQSGEYKVTNHTTGQSWFVNVG